MPPYPKKETSELLENFINVHNKGLAAVHTFKSPSEFVKKINDPRLINNLRDDGGGENKEDYQLHTNISTTLLPKSGAPVTQRLYTAVGSYLFIGLDMNKTKIKSFSPMDSQSHYDFTNKHGRPTYRPSWANKFLEMQKNHQERVVEVSRLNNILTRAAIEPKKDFLGRQASPSFMRGMNELILKIDIESMACIGICGDRLLEKPERMYNLLAAQVLFQEYTGNVYPIVIYNNTEKSLAIDFADPSKQIGVNEFTKIEPHIALRKLQEKFPEGIDFHTIIPDYHSHLDSKGSSKVTAEKFNLEVEQDSERREILIHNVKLALKSLEVTLPQYSELDQVIITHKEGREHTEERDKYKEIDQTNLKKFIKKNESGFTTESEEKVDNLVKAYNLQFRLGVYLELLSNKDSMVNYPSLQEDLNWSKSLLKKINTHASKENPIREKTQIIEDPSVKTPLTSGSHQPDPAPQKQSPQATNTPQNRSTLTTSSTVNFKAQLKKMRQPNGIQHQQLTEMQAKECFLKAHSEVLSHDKASIFGSFKQTNVRENANLKDILEHAMKENNRSRLVCIELGWLNKNGDITDDAPDIVKQCTSSDTGIKYQK